MAITNGFEMVFNRRLIFGENKVTEIPGILNWYNKKKVLFVTFSAEFDAFKKISSLLTDAGMAVVPYEVKTEPTLQIIDHGRDIYVAEGCDCTIALGGGIWYNDSNTLYLFIRLSERRTNVTVE